MSWWCVRRVKACDFHHILWLAIWKWSFLTFIKSNRPTRSLHSCSSSNSHRFDEGWPYASHWSERLPIWSLGPAPDAHNDRLGVIGARTFPAAKSGPGDKEMANFQLIWFHRTIFIDADHLLWISEACVAILHAMSIQCEKIICPRFLQKTTQQKPTQIEIFAQAQINTHSHRHTGIQTKPHRNTHIKHQLTRTFEPTQ